MQMLSNTNFLYSKKLGHILPQKTLYELICQR